MHYISIGLVLPGRGGRLAMCPVLGEAPGSRYTIHVALDRRGTLTRVSVSGRRNGTCSFAANW